MKFIIQKIILWPKKEGLRYRVVEFQPDKINIITGASRTGKSALIPIIDYCFGSHKCAIPVDIIRNATAWFGVLFSADDAEYLICRKEPGLNMATDEAYFLRAKKIEIPDVITANNNMSQIKNLLNELFSISFLDIDPTSNDYSARPSYRDLVAFLFQPQNVIANSDIMLFKADTTEHRQKLIHIFPYILGAVTPEILAARQEIERLRKIRDRKNKEFSALKEMVETWKIGVISWLSQAKDIGLIDGYSEDASFEEQVHCLANIVSKSENEANIKSSNIKDMSSEIVALREEEHRLSSQLFAWQKRLTEMLQLKKSVNNYEDALRIQQNRLEISRWLKEMSQGNSICPFCNSHHEGIANEMDKLCQAIEEIEKSADNIKTMPAAFEREFQFVSREIEKCSEKLKAVSDRIRSESGTLNARTDKKYTLSGISRFLGKLEANLDAINKLGKNNELEEEINQLNKRINALSVIIDEKEITKKQEAALKYINQKTGELIHLLDAEHPEDPVEFLIKDLTIKIKNNSGRDDYLWEIGSASNWLAYHIATILAFQQFFQTRGKVKVPNFIVFDQPSQVYFPQRSSKSDNELEIGDEDKEAVKKVFICLDKFIKYTDKSVQIIVTEHADEDIWGDVDSVHLVEKWRNENKLIPSEWLD